MLMDGDTNIHQDAASRSFTQLGLLVGSFMLWEEDRNDPQPQRLENIMRWTLKLPPIHIDGESHYPRLGVSAPGFAHIYYTILQAKKRLEPLSKAQEANEEAITESFASLRNPSDSTRQDSADPYRHFEPHIDEFARYVKYFGASMKTAGLHHRAAVPRMYIWLDLEDIDWWVTAIRKTLDDYLRLTREKALTLLDVARRCEWLECSVFIPLDISQDLPTAITAEDEIMRTQSTGLAEKVYQAAERVYGSRNESHHLYISWDLFAFDFWEDNWRKQLVHRTMLALWTAWPHGMAWAPKPPEGYSSHSPSLKEATLLLTQLLPALRRYFLQVKDAHRLSLTKLEFGEFQTYYPPTFYFADPIQRPSKAATYIENTNVHHLISNCIEYEDPHADTLSWSSLEGSIASVRGETTQMGRYKARYLLLPIAARLDVDKVIGSDLDYIVDLLTFLEYKMCLEAEDIYIKVKDIGIKRAADSDTFNTVDYVTRKLANLVSTLPGDALKRGAEEFADLQLMLGRAQYSLEKMRGEAVQLERQYNNLVSSTNEFLRNTMILASNPNLLSLSSALMDAFPYRSLRTPMSQLLVYTTQLVTSSERLGALLELLSRAISNDDLKRRERLNRRIRAFGSIIAIVALLVALPTFFPDVNVQAIFKLFGHEAIYTSNTGKIALVMLGFALLPVVLWVCFVILRRMTDSFRSAKERDRFREYVLKFWNLADYATYTYEAEKRSKDGLPSLSPVLHPPPPSWFEKKWDNGRGAGNIDSQATTMLQKLWPYLDSPSQTSKANQQPAWSDNWQQRSEDMIAQVRTLSRLIHVFVLRPDWVPLPRALCIMRYKSLQFLEKPTISDNEFRGSLLYAGFTLEQVESLQNWLYEPVNLKWICENSVEKVAEALEKKGITANPSEDAINNWQGNLFSQEPASESDTIFSILGTRP